MGSPARLRLLACSILATLVASLSVTPSPAATPSVPTEGAIHGHTVAPAGLGDLYAINYSTRHVVRFDKNPDGSFRWTVVGSGFVYPATLQVGPDGTVWVADYGTGQLIRVSPTGQQRAVLALDGPLPWGSHPRIVADRAGNVFLFVGDRLIRVTADGSWHQVMGDVEDWQDLGIDKNGRVTVIFQGPDRIDSDGFPWNVDLATFGVRPGVPTYRFLEDQGYGGILNFAEAPDGSVVAELREVGISEAKWVVRVRPGSVSETYLGTESGDPAFALSDRGEVYLLQTKVWCADPHRGVDGCPLDDYVANVQVYPSDSEQYTKEPVSNVVLPRNLAANAGGDLFTSGENSPTESLTIVPAGGGRAQPIVRGHFYSLVVPPGH